MLLRVKKSERVYRGKVFSVRRDLVREPRAAGSDPIEVVREVVDHTGSVVLLPVLPDGRILLVRQYRYALRRLLWELPAGRIEPQENPLAAARRELQEETGYQARRWRRLLKLFPTPGFVSEVMILYEARGLHRGEARPDPDEVIRVRAFTVKNLLQRIRQGKLPDAKSVAGIFSRGSARASCQMRRASPGSSTLPALGPESS